MKHKNLFLILALISKIQALDFDGSATQESPDISLEHHDQVTLPAPIPLGVKLSILKGTRLAKIAQKYSNFTNEQLTVIAEDMKKSRDITDAQFDYLTKPGAYTSQIVSRIQKFRKHTNRQLETIEKMPSRKQEILLYILNKFSKDEMLSDNRKLTHKSIKLNVRRLKELGLVLRGDTRYLKFDSSDDKINKCVTRINDAADSILETEEEPTYKMLAERTGYTLDSLYTLISKNKKLGHLTADKFLPFNQKEKISNEFQKKVTTLLELIRKKAPLQELLDTMDVKTKLQLNRHFQRLYEESLLTPEDVAYLKEPKTIVQRRGKTKEQVLSFITQCYQNNRHFSMLSNLWDTFNLEGNQGARAIGRPTLGTHYKELVKKGLVSQEIQSYIDTIRDRGKAIFDSNKGNISNINS